MSHSTSTLTQLDLMQTKKQEQRAKTRARMARYRAKLKELPLEEQEGAQERARLAHARYRANHRTQLRLRARDDRASQYAEKHGVEAYKAKLEKKRLKQLDDEGRRRRVVHPRAPRKKNRSAGGTRTSEGI
ncbi:hypothetical protein C8R45DRAFT_942404 [Mycena sanguinolenta]|nr:hypothetical protein C8R45DRAFT_942404 [Mycena sanguinolenta]